MINPLVYEIVFKDGRIYRVLCNNSNQVARMSFAIQRIKPIIAKSYALTNGITPIGDFEDHVEHEAKKIKEGNRRTYTNMPVSEILANIEYHHQEEFSEYLHKTL